MALDNAASLDVAGLTRRSGSRTLLDKLALTAASRSLTALVGPPGSGKSLLLRVLAGLEPARGTMTLDGVDLGRLPPHRRGFGVVLQHDALFPHMTLAGNIAFPLRMRGISRPAREKLVAGMLDLLGLVHRAGAYPALLDHAERASALLGRAMVASPPLVLLDEPFAGLDQAARTAALATLGRLHAILGTITLLATRSGDDALAVADRLAVLRGGAVEQMGTPEDIFERPGNAYVAQLFGELNRLDGVVAETDDDLATVSLRCGPVVEARLVGALQPGDPCLLAVRPERLAIAAVPAAEMGEGALDATLIAVQFLGDSCRLTLMIGSGAELIVRRPAAAGLRGLSAGRSVAVAWQPHHACAFAAENSAGRIEQGRPLL